MRHKLIMLGGIVVLLGSGCETSKGNGDQAGMQAPASDILTEPSATDQAETTAAAPDSVEVITADTIPQTP